MDWDTPGWEIAIKLGLAVVLAGICGLERERKGRGAGLRTHVLVCLGATMAMIVNEIFAEEIEGLAQFSAPVDKGRAIQGILTGIGFLGAGTIMNVGFANRGLTTAAMVWFTAALGIAIGSGQFALAVMGTVCALFTTIALERIESVIYFPERFYLKITMGGTSDFISSLESAVAERRYRTKLTYLACDQKDESMTVHFEVSTWKKRDPQGLANALRQRFTTITKLEIAE
jgi:putative Mg2+ transporter-C (MgtC) family protein